ncbi:MAG: hypothetical protein V3U80_04020 [Flavobacteriaceae bacterium]
MTLKNYIENLTKKNQIEIALKLISIALPIWTKFAINNKLSYTESVTGTHQTIKGNLLEKALQTVNQEFKNPNSKQNDLKILFDTFTEPITAIQDNDWDLPKEVSLVFYAIYNLLIAIKDHELSLHISINQACDAILKAELLSSKALKELLYNYSKSSNKLKKNMPKSVIIEVVEIGLKLVKRIIKNG